MDYPIVHLYYNEATKIKILIIYIFGIKITFLFLNIKSYNKNKLQKLYILKINFKEKNLTKLFQKINYIAFVLLKIFI